MRDPDIQAVLLGLYGRTEDNFKGAIAAYLESHETVKIMTTYDSLPKVCISLVDLGRNPYKDMHLVIDEWHLMMNSYGFRREAIRGLIKKAHAFSAVTYISATPVKKELWPKFLTGLREWEIQ